MARPNDLPPAEKFSHGTRARYVSGCRCEDCRRSNREYYHERQRRSKEAAAQITSPAVPVEQVWTAPDGVQKIRLYRRACPGVNGVPCPKQSHLRKDSKGGVCGECRLKLAWNGLVDAAKARGHLLLLSERGVGRRAVQAASDVADTVLEDIKNGKKQRIRASTEKAILDVDEKAISDGALVPAKDTWKRLRKLLRMGFTKTEIATALGSESEVPALQIRRDMVLARTAHRVQKLFDKAMAEWEQDEKESRRCPECDGFHKKKDRLEMLKLMLPASVNEIQELKPCVYRGPSGDNRNLYRDLRDLGAVNDEPGSPGSVWRLVRR